MGAQAMYARGQSCHGQAMTSITPLLPSQSLDHARGRQWSTMRAVVLVLLALLWVTLGVMGLLMQEGSLVRLGAHAMHLQQLGGVILQHQVAPQSHGVRCLGNLRGCTKRLQRLRYISNNFKSKPYAAAAASTAVLPDALQRHAPFSVYKPFGQLFESRPESGTDSTVIWLHAGAGHGLVSLLAVGADFRHLLPSTAFLFPSGKMRLPFPRWISFGYAESLKTLQNTQDLLNYGELEGLAESVEYVHAIIDHEIARGIAPERIFLSGYSQGGALALAAGLSAKVRLGGILGLSTFLLGRAPAAAPQVPVHLFHGDADPIVPLSWAEHTQAELQASGVSVNLQVYPGLGHSRCVQENRDIAEVLRSSLDTQERPSAISGLSEAIPSWALHGLKPNVM